MNAPATNGDPPGRIYPPFVTLLRRSCRRQDEFAPCALSGLEDWLLGDAVEASDMLALFETFVWRLGAAGLPIDRASLHVGTLHPQVFGYAWNWDRETGICDEIKVAEESLNTDAYRRNPIFRVIEFGESVYKRVDRLEDRGDSPLLAELAGAGYTEYAAAPLRASTSLHNAVTLATKQDGGFTKEQAALLKRLYRFLALHVERHVATLISGNVLDTYLGQAAGAQVLQGTIKRGSGAPIDAIIWVSDLRGFTARADRLPGPAMLKILNAYFDQLVGAVTANRGEVLKFIGDGLLAVFPYQTYSSKSAAADAALTAANTAQSALAELNVATPDPYPEIPEWRPLETGIALHAGSVFFGNMGSPERLDFTVIGPAVNAAARVESLCKELGRPLLLTQAVADLLSRDLRDLGAYRLKGVSEPVRLFVPEG
ncbi:adenylate/guanylate cyclase domain-containing protein [Nisaea acidiphila]|uniref:Adenylate/guanylate cyclase domain-containing protein n=1 Tax=Nisaea acidiphila TaxID=1862145 RepID=A0A9J7APM9_9PROT|nr:adenylate/guanylate cyclase domain-containing protein [Nisaea acidiphila]UUX48308.1 adenylate/guanylate cyclase domain-containing protein [Nisaea acidiphila]